MKRIGLIAALALIVLTNVIVLATVRHNRSGEPDATVTLTERELRLWSNSKENSAVSLKLELHPDHNQWSELSPWFDQKKLEEIGFDCSTPLDAKDPLHRYDKLLPRRTYVVLEYEGQAWKTWLAGREQQVKALQAQVAKGREQKEALEAKQKQLQWERESGSRLLAIDAGNDTIKLRTRYPDRSKYIITPAKVRLRLIPVNSTNKLQKPLLSGYVDEILINEIHVPRDRQGVLATLKPNEHNFYGGSKETFTPRYRVTLKYGRRYEPWVAEVVTK